MARSAPELLASHFHAPSDTARAIFYVALRAGALRADPEYRVSRDRYPGHDLLFCLRGAGVVRADGRDHAVSSGQLAWIDCSRPHAHQPDARRPWELLWARIDGPAVTATAEVLAVREAPVFDLSTPVAVETSFRQLLGLMAARGPQMEADVHVVVAALVAQLVTARQATAGAPGATRGDPGLRRVLARMTAESYLPWRIAELARLAGMSVPHFHRRFRRAFGASPLDFVRRERLRHAQRRLLETDEPIKEIAFRVGYRDPYYFSRDFRALVGVAPRTFRRKEPTR